MKQGDVISRRGHEPAARPARVSALGHELVSTCGSIRCWVVGAENILMNSGHFKLQRVARERLLLKNS